MYLDGFELTTSCTHGKTSSSLTHPGNTGVTLTFQLCQVRPKKILGGVGVSSEQCAK